MTCLCVSHYFPTLWRRVSHRPPSMSLSLSYPSLSFLVSAPVLGAPAPAAPISAQYCWLEPMLHLACPLRPWGHSWRAKPRQAHTQARLLWPGGAESRRMSGGLWAGERPAGNLWIKCWLTVGPAEQVIEERREERGKRGGDVKRKDAC